MMEIENAEYKKMTETKVSSLIVRLSIPTTISMLVSAVYNMADTYFVSKINNSASAAISVVFSLMSLIQAIGFTLGMGAGSIISRSLGKKDEEHANKVASSTLFIGTLFGIIFMTLGLIFLNGFMKLLGSTETALPYAIEYGKYILIATPFMILAFILNNLLRSEGKARFAMIGLMSGGILNIVLDAVFINVCHMGITGAAIATAISQFVSFLILTTIFLLRKTILKISFKKIDFHFSVYGHVIKEGSPTLFRQGFASVATIILNYLCKPYGDALLAALGITNKVYLFIRNLVIGIGQGYQPVVGYNYGAKKYERIKEAFKFTCLLSTSICIICTVIVLIFAKQLITVFRNDPEVIAIGTKSIRYLAISLPFLGYSTMVNQSLQVTGYSKTAAFLASCRQGIVYIPVIFLFNSVFGLTGLCLTQPVSDFITFLISIPFNVWFFKIINRLIKEQNDLNNTNTLQN